MAKSKSQQIAEELIGPASPETQAAAVPESSNGEKPKPTKKQRFDALIGKRMMRAIKALGAVGNLAAKTSYEYTDAVAAKIVRDLTRAVQRVEDRFKGQSVVKETWSAEGE